MRNVAHDAPGARRIAPTTLGTGRTAVPGRWTWLVGSAAIGTIVAVVAGPSATAQDPACTLGVIGTETLFAAAAGEQCYEVPAGVRRMRVVATGGGGGGSGNTTIHTIGRPAQVLAVLDVTAGERRYAMVGQGGGRGGRGFSIPGGAGGGATDLRVCSSLDPGCPAVGSVRRSADPCRGRRRRRGLRWRRRRRERREAAQARRAIPGRSWRGAVRAGALAPTGGGGGGDCAVRVAARVSLAGTGGDGIGEGGRSRRAWASVAPPL